MTFKFLHAADLHLDSPFIALGRVDEELARTLRDASLNALDNIVKLAVKERANFVLFAGDIYDGSRRGVRAQSRFLYALRELEKHKIQAFIVYGNHDPVNEGWSAIAKFPANTHVFSAEGPETIEIDGCGQRVTVTGMSFPTRHVTVNLSRRFDVPNGEGFHIALLHTALDDPERGKNYSPSWTADLKRSGFDYWALGHIHTRTEPGSHPYIVYPGNPIGRGFGANERGEKGVYLVEVAGDQVEITFKVTGNTAFFELKVDASGCNCIADIQDAILSTVPDSELDGVVETIACRVRIQGRTSVYDDLKRAETLQQLPEALVDSVNSRRRVFWTDIRDETLPELDLDAYAESESFLGVLIREATSERSDLAAALAEARNEDFSDIDSDTMKDIQRRALERAAHLINL